MTTTTTTTGRTIGRPRAQLSRRGRALLWCDRHPVLAQGAAVAGGLVYLWAALGLCVTFA